MARLILAFGCTLLLFSSAGGASSIEDCAGKYGKKGKFYSSFAYGQGVANLGTGMAIEIFTTATVVPAAFPISLPVAGILGTKSHNYTQFSEVLLAVAEGDGASELSVEEFREFRNAVNDKLVREEELNNEELSQMIHGLVAKGQICQGVKRVKKKKKTKFTGWVMKPKKVKKLIRRMARAKAEREANGEEVVEISTLINELP